MLSPRSVHGGGRLQPPAGRAHSLPPFHEPSIVAILVHVSFVLLLNVVNYLRDALTYCGLVGQVLLSVFCGTPLGGFLPRDTEVTAVILGYLGLILIVYEGKPRAASTPTRRPTRAN